MYDHADPWKKKFHYVAAKLDKEHQSPVIALTQGSNTRSRQENCNLTTGPTNVCPIVRFRPRIPNMLTNLLCSDTRILKQTIPSIASQAVAKLEGCNPHTGEVKQRSYAVTAIASHRTAIFSHRPLSNIFQWFRKIFGQEHPFQSKDQFCRPITVNEKDMLRFFWRCPWQVPPAVQHSGTLDSKTPWPSRICVLYSSVIVNRLAALPPVLLRLSLINTPAAYEADETTKHERTWTTPSEKCHAPEQNSLYTNVFARWFKAI